MVLILLFKNMQVQIHTSPCSLHCQILFFGYQLTSATTFSPTTHAILVDIPVTSTQDTLREHPWANLQERLPTQVSYLTIKLPRIWGNLRNRKTAIVPRPHRLHGNAVEKADVSPHCHALLNIRHLTIAPLGQTTVTVRQCTESRPSLSDQCQANYQPGHNSKTPLRTSTWHPRLHHQIPRY